MNERAQDEKRTCSAPDCHEVAVSEYVQRCAYHHKRDMWQARNVGTCGDVRNTYRGERY